MTKQRLLGIALTSTRRRHAAVILFYTVSVLLCGVVGDTRGLSVLLLVPLCSLLGGVEDGPVKRFESRHSWNEIRRAVRTNWGRMHIRPRDANDEFDLARRDHAHYVAYRILRRVGLCAVVGVACVDLIAGRRISALHGEQLALALEMFGFLAYIVCHTLPQAVLLWTQQDPFDDIAAGPA